MMNNLILHKKKKCKSVFFEFPLQLCMSTGADSFKLVIFGAAGVGKTALVIMFVQSHVEDYDPTIENSYKKQVIIDAANCVLDIVDTAGDEEFACFSEQIAREGEGFLCAYDITEKNSLEEVKRKVELIRRVRDSYCPPIILVGNKCDADTERQVSQTEAQELMRSLNCTASFETSAKERINVDEVFFELVRQIKRANAEDCVLK